MNRLAALVHERVRCPGFVCFAEGPASARPTGSGLIRSLPAPLLRRRGPLQARPLVTLTQADARQDTTWRR